MNKILGLIAVSLLMISPIWGKEKQQKFQSLNNGLEYRFVTGKPKTGKSKAKEGDRLAVSAVFMVNDSILSDSRNKTPQLVVFSNNYKNENAFLYQLPLEGLQLMQVGDSAIFRILVKDFFDNQKIKPIKGWKESDYLYWQVKAVDFESRHHYETRMKGFRLVKSYFDKVDSLLEYKIIKLGAGGDISDIGDMIKIHVNYKIGDSLIFKSTTLDGGRALPQQITPPGLEGDLMKGFMILQEGDTALFRIKHSDYEKNNVHNVNDQIPDSVYHTWEVKIENLRTKTKMAQEKELYTIKQNAKDFEIIEQYLKEKNWKPTLKLPNGLVYVETKSGSGRKPQEHNEVVVNYTGMFLDGEKFDSNTDPSFKHVEPLKFEIGKKQVIQGWDEGLQLMQKGSKGYLIIPSTLGYGNRAQGPIPENSILVFEVELLDFK